MLQIIQFFIAIFTFSKKNIKTIINSIIVILILIALVYILNLRQQNKKLHEQLYQVHLFGANNAMVIAQKFKFYDSEIRLQSNLIGYYKKQIYEFKNAIQETIFTTDNNNAIRQKVSFSKEYPTLSLKGYTLTNPPFARLEIDRKPLSLKLQIKKKAKDIYTSILWTSDPDLEIKTLDVKYSGFEEQKRSFFGMIYGLGYESEINDYNDIKLDKFDVGVGIRLDSYGILPSIKLDKDFIVKIELLKIF